MTEWKQTACILCECNCGIEVELDGRTLSRIRGDRAHPGSQGYTCNKAMRLDHYQNGRHRLQSPMRRRPDGTYEEIGWDTAIAEIAERPRPGPRRARRREDLLLRRRRAGQPPRRRLRELLPARARRALPLQRARPGEDRRVLGRLAPLRRPHPRRVRARRGIGLRRQEPVDVAELPARSGDAARDRQGPRALDDRDRPGGHRHGEDGRLPPARPARRPTPGAWPRWPRSSFRRTSSTATSSTSARRGAEPLLEALREVDVAEYAGAVRRRRGADPRGRAAHRFRRQRLGLRGPRDPAGAEQRPLLLPEQAALDPDRQLRPPGDPAPALVDVPPRPLRRARAAHAGDRLADPRRPRGLQRDRRGDPHRPPRPLPGDDRRELQPGPLAGRLGPLRARRSTRWSWSSWSTSR